MSDPESLQALADRIRATGALGRSQLIQKLFDFLIECSATGRAPKETEVAIEVFGRDAGFDVAQDAMVRVYVHKLRRKLEEYYSARGCSDPFQLTIPKGAYRIIVNDREVTPAEPPVPEPVAEAREAVLPVPAPVVIPTRRRWLWPTLAASLIVNLLLFGLLFWHGARTVPANPVLSNPLWARMLNS